MDSAALALASQEDTSVKSQLQELNDGLETIFRNPFFQVRYLVH